MSPCGTHQGNRKGRFAAPVRKQEWWWAGPRQSYKKNKPRASTASRRQHRKEDYPIFSALPYQRGYGGTCLTERIYKVVLQKSIPTKILQLILDIGNNEGKVYEFVLE